MRFILMVTGPAYGTQQASSAYQFAQALLATDHDLASIFFYREGVYNANLFTSPAYDEVDLVRAWKNLHDQYNVALYICRSAALRRGVTDILEVNSAVFAAANLQEGFLFSSLGTLAEAVLTCDRMIQF